MKIQKKYVFGVVILISIIALFYWWLGSRRPNVQSPRNGEETISTSMAYFLINPPQVTVDKDGLTSFTIHVRADGPDIQNAVAYILYDPVVIRLFAEDTDIEVKQLKSNIVMVSKNRLDPITDSRANKKEWVSYMHVKVKGVNQGVSRFNFLNQSEVYVGARNVYVPDQSINGVITVK
jgi:hypothetical protein